MKGKFKAESFSNWPTSADKILWDKAYLAMGISDLTGLDQIKKFDWNNKQIEMEGGIPFQSSVRNGICSGLVIDPEKEHDFTIDISLNGSESLFFVPAGKSTYVSLASAWCTPSFDGAQLPDNREVNQNGFTAEWNALHLTRSFPQKWSGNMYEYEIPESAFGVNLLIPIDNYQKTTRSVKYALLFIGLTFLVIFFIEVMSKKKIHPVQYLLTGIALVIFYSLLLALSEHLNFTLAYLVASISIIGLIVIYSGSIFKNRNYTMITMAVLISLYGFLYAILNMSDFALLLGNIGLFVILAIVMFFSKKIDWYNGKQGRVSE
jgi:inner membrane protein